MLIRLLFLLVHITPIPLISRLACCTLIISLLPRLLIHTLSTILIPTKHSATVTLENGYVCNWYDDCYKLASVSPRQSLAQYSAVLQTATDRGYSSDVKVTSTPSGVTFSLADGGDSSCKPYSSALMVTLAASVPQAAKMGALLRKYDLALNGISFQKRKALYSLYNAAKNRIHKNTNNLRLCSCAIPVVVAGGRRYVMLTRRKNRSGKASTFSNMWVYPGGHVDMLPSGVSESPAAAAERELREETGLVCDTSSLEYLCAYNPVLVSKRRGYFILFYSCKVLPPVEASASASASSASASASAGSSLEAYFSGIDSKEVGAAALVPVEMLTGHCLSPRKITGMSHGEVVEVAARGVPTGGAMQAVEGVTVSETGDKVRTLFDASEFIGDGGEGDTKGGGVGMGHRFASYCFVEVLNKRSHKLNSKMGRNGSKNK
jgi:8-oxo-dGTP pyrophosphatase MutT (NUDIX family)